MHIEPANLDGTAFVALMEEHRDTMRAASPLESQHALDLDGLRQPDVRVWVLRDGDALAGCGALQHIDEAHAEIKAMRTALGYQRRGVAKAMLAFLVGEAKQRGYTRLSLETGATDYFIPARTLYAAAGFEPCGPFADYEDDPNSAYLTRTLD
ncbi:GNAT family N-acetyltransferase [Luteimonas aestuarii]|uniref:GNAT family N-acetyltransferase n=1 Tax=Luteimonas aestuarii TaxID=453837 RepID=A0A4R5U3Y2_9GAMM|nr:GNAT family N-acetyltransferase [Luteimonas aestuarii]TDK28407.1 GNAT family N-acetyltransferase [Luteimonas aestuarii]